MLNGDKMRLGYLWLLRRCFEL